MKLIFRLNETEKYSAPAKGWLCSCYPTNALICTCHHYWHEHLGEEWTQALYQPEERQAIHNMLNLYSVCHPHSGAMTAAKLQSTLDQWNIVPSKLLMAVTSNGSNKLKAVKQPQFKLHAPDDSDDSSSQTTRMIIVTKWKTFHKIFRFVICCVWRTTCSSYFAALNIKQFTQVHWVKPEASCVRCAGHLLRLRNSLKMWIDCTEWLPDAMEQFIQNDCTSAASGSCT